MSNPKPDGHAADATPLCPFPVVPPSEVIRPRHPELVVVFAPGPPTTTEKLASLDSSAQAFIEAAIAALPTLRARLNEGVRSNVRGPNDTVLMPSLDGPELRFLSALHAAMRLWGRWNGAAVERAGLGADGHLHAVRTGAEVEAPK